MSDRDEIKRLVGQLHDDLANRLYGKVFTTAEAEPLPTLRVEDLVRTVHRLQMQERQSRVTFVVDLAHDGPMLGYRTATEGQIFELSWMQAQHLHGHWPLKLVKVLSAEKAEFAPATPFDQFVPKVLDMPPYELPEQPDEDEAQPQ